MVQAAASGVVDFGRADPRDPKWWRYLRLIVDQVEQNNLKEYHRLYNDRVVAMLTRTDLTPEGTDKMLDESVSRIDSIVKILFPWVEIDREAAKQDQAKQLRATWEAWFGKLDDPETQRRIQATADWLRDVKKTPGRGRR